MHRLAAPLLIVSATILLAGACGISIDFDGPRVRGSGVIVSESRSVSAFDAISIAGSIDADIQVGPDTSITITADDNIIPLIETEVSGRRLKVDHIQRYSSHRAVRVEITVPDLTAVTSSGSSDINISGVQASRFDLNVSGSSDMIVDGDYGDLDVSVSGSSDLDMRGAADDVDVSVSGSADVNMSEVVARRAQVSVSGSGDVMIHVTDDLDATVSGSGNVEYTGRPEVHRRVHGSGSIRGRG